MGKRRKHLEKMMSGKSDANVPFERTRNVLKSLGFEERISGDHHVFVKDGVPELIDIQPTRERKCKPYQVRQMRKVLRDNGLA